MLSKWQAVDHSGSYAVGQTDDETGVVEYLRNPASGAVRRFGTLTLARATARELNRGGR